MNDPKHLAETIFIGTRQLRDDRDRASYLEKACAGDAALRAEVERMLQAEQKADQFLEDNPFQLDDVSAIAEVAEKVGSVIGPYKLLQRIGEGGCGMVYMAEQEKPIRRRVALKVIKPGMDTRHVIARFEAERQALAMMDHPNIARVLDAGATENGRPYFVMELVRGIKLTDYCDQNNLSTRDRLDLFTKVVQAVQHAHQKGIIHRDLKPSNVLVTLHDGVPVPKVIDFGIAKAMEQKLTDKTLFTQFEQFIGTPAYTSPEQAEMSGLDVDTRSDIYSLGVLLYELLVGRTPFDSKELLRSGINEMRRMIREKEPDRPSTCLSTMLAEERTATAKQRAVSSPDLIHLLKGDLDWIVMKCLEKDRTRRYDTASALASDIQNYLSNVPVIARPPSATYRVAKLIRRNKLVVAAGSAVALSLVIGIILSAWQASRAHRAEQAATVEKDSAEAVLKFFRDNVLSAGRPEGLEGGLGKDVTMRKVIDTAESRIAQAFTNQPLVEASIRETLAESYQHLGELDLAVKQMQQALALRQKTLGPANPDTISLLQKLVDLGRAKETLPSIQEAVDVLKRKRGPVHPDTLWAMNLLAGAYLDTGAPDKAVPLFTSILALDQTKLPRQDRQRFDTKVDLARALIQQRKFDEGLAMLKETLALEKTYFQPNDSLILSTLQVTAEALADYEKFTEAIPYYQEWHSLAQTKFGPDHPQTLITVDRLAYAISQAKKEEPNDRALPMWEEAYNRQKAKLGPDHPEAIFTRLGLAGAYQNLARYDEALQLFEESLQLAKVKYGPKHKLTIGALDGVVEILSKQGKYDEVEERLRVGILELRKVSPWNNALLSRRAHFRAGRGEFKMAAADFSEAIKLKPTDYELCHRLTACYVQLGDVESYRSLCSRIVPRVGDATKANLQQRAQDCSILPDAQVDLSVFDSIEETAVLWKNTDRYRRWLFLASGLVKYRQGHCAEAVALAEKGLQLNSKETGPGVVEFGVQALMLEAMSRHQLQQHDAARSALTQGLQLAEAKLPKPENGIMDWWTDWVFAHALMREARSLIQSDAQ